jgi:hypothetical protein
MTAAWGGPGLARVADASLRSLGGETVLLHISAPAVPGDPGEQIGLATPQFQNLTIGPAVLRKLRPRIATAENERPAEYELLLSASAVTRALGDAQMVSAEVLFAQACAITVGGRLLQITSATAVEGFGQAYLYRLGLRAAAADLT